MPSPIGLTLSFICGLLAAVAVAILWGAITAATSFQIGYMAVGVGFAVAFAVRLVAGGANRPAAYMAAALSLFGCALGNYLAAVTMTAQHEHADIVAASINLLPMFFDVLRDTFSPMDVLFYALGVYFGYKYALGPKAAPQVQPAPSAD